MRKAQMASRPLFSVLLILIAMMILAFGTTEIVKWAQTSKSIELISFNNNLANLIKKQAVQSSGSVEEKSIALNPSIKSICFVDRGKEISPLVKCTLNPEMNKYPEKNVFFEPYDKFAPIDVKGFELSENPLCLEPANAVLRLSLTSKGNSTMLSTFRPSDKSVDCVSVVYNSPPNNSIDIVFLGYGYSSYEDYRQDVDENINTILSVSPFNESAEKLNFYRVDKLDQLACQINQMIKCDEYEVKKLASFCPNDYIIILVDRNKIKDLLNPVRSSAIGNIEKINTADNNLVILHEFGHTFGNLADEYVDEKYYSNIAFDPGLYPNCDFPPECKEWSQVDGSGCFDGCSLKKFARPTVNSIMRSLSMEKFGPVNEKVLMEKLDKYG